MKALILNSGLGSRMGEVTANHPKCMTDISATDTIISRQLKQLVDYGINEVVITTGPFADALEKYCLNLGLPIRFNFVNNTKYKETNYMFLYIQLSMPDNRTVGLESPQFQEFRIRGFLFLSLGQSRILGCENRI